MNEIDIDKLLENNDKSPQQQQQQQQQQLSSSSSSTTTTSTLTFPVDHNDNQTTVTISLVFEQSNHFKDIYFRYF